MPAGPTSTSHQSVSEQSDFSALAGALRSGDIPGADSQAAALGYEVVEFTDTLSGDAYYVLREQLVGGAQTKGWGTYVVNLEYQSEALIEVPHLLFDTNSWDIGAKLFRDADVRGFLMAGAHRNANGSGTADVAHLGESIFQEVHEAWNGPGGETTAWQIHGFSLANHGTFPTGTDAVLSNGDGGVSSGIVDLDGRFETGGFLTYAYNTLAAADPINVQVNADIDGTTFSSLAATDQRTGHLQPRNWWHLHPRGAGAEHSF